MNLPDLLFSNCTLTPPIHRDIVPEIQKVCLDNDDIAKFKCIGKSVEGRDIFAFTVGTGPKKVSLIAGSHADEPVGASTISLFLIETLKNRKALSSLFQHYTFYCIPFINPDGEVRNQAWLEIWPDISAYITLASRELPGNDIEFGYPQMRPENQAASKFWKSIAPLHLHISLHGMGFAEGAMLLIERHWSSRTQNLRDAFAKFASDLQIGLHVHNRKGEKGFFYIEDGFSTTPEAEAMKSHFLSLHDPQTASFFHNTSMEYIRSLGGDPLCLVTEIPLFKLRSSNQNTKVPDNYLKFKKLLPNFKDHLIKGDSIEQEIKKFIDKPIDFKQAIKLQLFTIDQALKLI